MDKKIANNIIVAITVLVGFAGFIFLIFNVDGGGTFFSSQYSLFGKFRQVRGLHYGSEVSLSGLRVGFVKDISISKDDTKELIVEFQIARKMQDRIRQDSTATIKTQGVLGDKYIEISIGSPDREILKPNDPIASAEDEDILSKGGDLVNDLRKQFDKGGELENLFRNLNLAVGNLATITNDIRANKGLYHEFVGGTTGPQINKASYHLSEILRKIDDGEGTLVALINYTSVYEDVKTMLGGAKISNVLRYFMRIFIEDGDKEKSENTDDKKPAKKNTKK